jgi:Helix-turn-helix domain
MLWQSQWGSVMQVTIAEAAERLRLSERTVRRRVKAGELPGCQLSTPQGYVWMVDLPDDWTIGQVDNTGEVKVLREWIDQLSNQLDLMQNQLEAKDKQTQSQLEAKDKQTQSQLEAKDKQIEQLHVLLQQAQAALPASKNNHSWWRFWQRG